MRAAVAVAISVAVLLLGVALADFVYARAIFGKHFAEFDYQIAIPPSAPGFFFN